MKNLGVEISTIELGIDIGNGYTKFNEKRFASKTKVGRVAGLHGLGSINSEVHEVEKNDVTYVVGDGELFTDPKRHFTNDYDLCLYTAIGLSSEERIINAKICVGLPVIAFMSEKRAKLQEKLNGLIAKGSEKVKIDGIEKIISIKKAVVFCEGSYVLESMEKGNVITVDIGAGTVNVIQWDNLVPVHYETVEKSFNKLYKDIATHIKNTGRGNVTPAYIEENFGKESILINGKLTDISDTKEIIRKYVSALVSNVYEICEVPQAEKIKIFGGGAIATKEYWKDSFGEDREGVEVLNSCQYTNSRVFQKVIERIG